MTKVTESGHSNQHLETLFPRCTAAACYETWQRLPRLTNWPHSKRPSIAYFSVAMSYLSSVADIKLVLCDSPQRVQKLLANKSETPNLKIIICFHCVHACVKKMTKDSAIEVVTFQELEVQQYSYILSDKGANYFNSLIGYMLYLVKHDNSLFHGFFL